MSMPSRRLVPLQQVAESREDQALQRVMERHRTLAEREQRLSELQAYLQEYQKAVPGTTPSMLVNRQAFVARLREAERFQRQAVETARAECDSERARWMLKRRDVAVLDQLAACYHRKERRDEERHAQRHLDEFALRQFIQPDPVKGEIF